MADHMRLNGKTASKKGDPSRFEQRQGFILAPISYGRPFLHDPTYMVGSNTLGVSIQLSLVNSPIVSMYFSGLHILKGC